MFNQHSDLTGVDDYLAKNELNTQKVELDKQLLKLIQMCCHHSPAPELQKALDYANLLLNINSLEAASKISKFFNLVGLYDRIIKIKESRELHATIDPSKRLSKYAHLEDYDIITGSKPFTAGSHRGSGKEVFNKPFDERVSKPHSQGGGGLLTKGNVFKQPLPKRIQDQENVAEEWQEEEEKVKDENYDWARDDPVDDLTTPMDEQYGNDVNQIDKRPRLSEYHLGSEATAQKSVCKWSYLLLLPFRPNRGSYIQPHFP